MNKISLDFTTYLWYSYVYKVVDIYFILLSSKMLTKLDMVLDLRMYLFLKKCAPLKLHRQRISR